MKHAFSRTTVVTSWVVLLALGVLCQVAIKYAGLDTGPMLAVHRIEVSAVDDAQTLHDKLAALGARAIVEALAALAGGGLRAVPQPAEGATYARKIGKEDAEVDWRRPCDEIERQVRIAAGSLVLLGVVLGQIASPAFYAVSAFVGAGLTFAGISGWCGMARLLALMPWNRTTAAKATPQAG